MQNAVALAGDLSKFRHDRPVVELAPGQQNSGFASLIQYQFDFCEIGFPETPLASRSVRRASGRMFTASLLFSLQSYSKSGRA
jgi:hypothetical protein